MRLMADEAKKIEAAENNKQETRVPTMKDRQRELRERTILECARDLLSTKGFTAMTLDDVISAVGISKPTFYQHFTSKDQLIVSVLINELNSTCERVSEYSAMLPPDEALKAVIDWAVEQHFNSCTYYDLTSIVPLCAQQKIKGAEHELTKLLAKLIECAQKAGSIKTQTPPMLLAQFLNSILKDSAYHDEISKKKLTLPVMKDEVTKLLLG
jgi:AcrR family transcriptional regulator